MMVMVTAVMTTAMTTTTTTTTTTMMMLVVVTQVLIMLVITLAAALSRSESGRLVKTDHAQTHHDCGHSAPIEAKGRLLNPFPGRSKALTARLRHLSLLCRVRESVSVPRVATLQESCSQLQMLSLQTNALASTNGRITAEARPACLGFGSEPINGGCASRNGGITPINGGTRSPREPSSSQSSHPARA
eukprot:3925142-Rhodomonas_salina.4